MSKRRPLLGDMKNGKVVRVFDPWRSPLCTCPPKYSLQPYTGCSHFCLYCYATAYIGLKKSAPKKNFINRLKHDIRHVINPKYHIDISTSSDPYPPEEEAYKLTREALKLLVPLGYRVLIVTKGSLVKRDIDVISKGNVAVTFTITTLDKNLAKKLEPNAPLPSDRLEAINKLTLFGIPVGLRLDPLIPGLNDDEYSIESVIEAASSSGVGFLVTSTYKARPDNLKRMIEKFPEYADKWNKIYRREGMWIHGYWYAPVKLRKIMIERVRRIALKIGMEFATCREGFAFLHTAKTCDGSHLIPSRVRVKRLFS